MWSIRLAAFISGAALRLVVKLVVPSGSHSCGETLLHPRGLARQYRERPMARTFQSFSTVADLYISQEFSPLVEHPLQVLVEALL
jgi:hypothetical protein